MVINSIKKELFGKKESYQTGGNRSCNWGTSSRYWNKLNYVFGKATGDLKSIQRSTAMAKQLQRIGIFNTAEGNAYLKDHLINVFNSSKGIPVKKGFLLRT